MYEIMAYKFRIHPDDKRGVKINKRLILAQQLYNKILERIKSRYKTAKNLDINKAESAGMKIITVNSKNTTRNCSDCGNIQDTVVRKNIHLQQMRLAD